MNAKQIAQGEGELILDGGEEDIFLIAMVS